MQTLIIWLIQDKFLVILTLAVVISSIPVDDMGFLSCFTHIIVIDKKMYSVSS